MSEYTDTILLEANRRSSAEFLAGNLEKRISGRMMLVQE